MSISQNPNPHSSSILLLLALVLLLGSCYPVSVTRMKWRIKTDKEMKKGKESYMETSYASSSGRSKQPNVVLIICDDLGRYEVSAYEGVNHIATPHIDQIGADGVVFEDAYVTAPTCAPSRAGIITGRVQNRYGFETQLMEFYPTNMIEYLSGKIVDTDDWVVASKPQYPSEWQVHKQGVPTTEITMSEIFKKAGYATAKIGKWHLGVSKKQLPENRGFDYNYGFLGAFSLYTAERNWSHIVNHEHESFSAQHQWNNGRKGEGQIREHGKVIREEQYLTFALRDKAMNWMEEQKDNPFFLYLAFSAPHVPFQAPVDYYCEYSHIEDDNKRVYYAMISALDDAIGDVHQKIKDLGIEDNTIIYVISDNGGASYTEATDNGPLKGGKLTQFEGGINVPFVMKYPAKIPAGIRYPYPVSSTDIFATSLAQAGIPLPPDRPFDGVDLVPYITGENADQPHPQMFWRADHIWAVRDGDYKLILSTRDGWAELYNLKKDKSEEINLKDDMPDLYEALKQLHLQWQNNNLPDKPMWPRIMDHKFTLNGKEYLFPA